MNTMFLSVITHRSLYVRLPAVLVLTLLPVVSFYGDVPVRLRSTPAAACYCHCHESMARRGCIKLCDAKKRAAAQWLATSCIKPHFQPPPDKSHAGPHLRHPDHAEHAQLRRETQLRHATQPQ
jgi:hypothetical protein